MNDTIKWGYCPQCGERGLVVRDRRCNCSACGLEYFFNIASAAAAIIEHDGNVLLTRRGRDPKKGMLDLPGGFVDANETAEDSIRREIREELNIELASLRYLTSWPNRYLYNKIEYQVLDLFFVCKAAGIESIRPQDDVADYVWIRPEDISIDQFAFESTRNGVAYYLKT